MSDTQSKWIRLNSQLADAQHYADDMKEQNQSLAAKVKGLEEQNTALIAQLGTAYALLAKADEEGKAYRALLHTAMAMAALGAGKISDEGFVVEHMQDVLDNTMDNLGHYKAGTIGLVGALERMGYLFRITEKVYEPEE